VHNGVNSSGYLYSGGYLIFTKKSGKIIKAETEVTIYKGTSTYRYTVVIE
jgi:hypothetical protein